MVEAHSNLLWMDLSIFTVLVAIWYSWNWWVKAHGEVNIFNLATQELPSLVISGISSISLKTAGALWLVDTVHPFGMQHAVVGMDRLKLTSWAVATVRLCWHTMRFRSGSDSPPQAYGWNGWCISASRSALWSGVLLQGNSKGRFQNKQLLKRGFVFISSVQIDSGQRVSTSPKKYKRKVPEQIAS